jgi:hypothetical protein
MPITVSAQDPAARAATAAELKYGAQQSAIQRAIESLAGTRAADEAAINQYGTGGRNAINQTFDQLFGNLETNRQLTQDNLGKQVQSIGSGYREANQIAELARAQAADRLNKTFGNNRAYSAGSLADAMSPIEQLAAQVIGENANSDATWTGNLKNWAAQQDAFSQMGIAGAQRDKSNRLSGFESELLRALAAAKNQASEQEFDLQGNLLDTISERGSFQVDKTGEYLDQLFGQNLAAAQFNLSEQEAAAQAADRAAARALQERAQSFEESQVGRDDIWKQLGYDLDVRRQDASEQDQLRDWLAGQQQMSSAEKQYVANYLQEAYNAGLGEEGDPTLGAAARQRAYDELYNLGVGNLSKYGTTAAKPSLNVGVGGSAVAQASSTPKKKRSFWDSLMLA